MKKFDKIEVRGLKNLSGKKGIVVSVDKDRVEAVFEGVVAKVEKNSAIVLGEPVKHKSVTLPKLNGLPNITLMSTMLKIMEETGELSQVIGKKSGMNGEETYLSDKELQQEIGSELMDIVQSAFSMIFVLEDQYGLNFNALIENHVKKIAKKGYIK